VRTEPNDFSLLTVFALLFVAQVQKEKGKLCLLSGMFLFGRKGLLQSETYQCLWDKGLSILAMNALSL